MENPDAPASISPPRRRPAPDSGGEFVEYAQGQIIFTKGARARHLSIILQGSVEIFDPEDGRCIATLGKGASFGEQAILEGGVRNASARAVDAVTCLEIGTDPLRALLETDPGLLMPAVEALLLQLCMANHLSRLVLSPQADRVFEVASQGIMTVVQGQRKLGEAYTTAAKADSHPQGLSSDQMMFLKLQASKRLNSGAFDVGQKLTSHAGEHMGSAFVILKGGVEAVSNERRYRLGIGSVVGLAEGLSNAPFNWSLSAVSHVTVLILPIDRILSGIGRTNPGIKGIVRYTAARIIALQKTF